MNFKDAFKYWKTCSFFDESIRVELSALDEVSDMAEIEDRFYRDLEFGTGGLRGIMGAGTNRINIYTIGKATTGLGNYLSDTFSKDDCRVRGVAIAGDTRNNSREFVNAAADVLTGMGIKVYVIKDARPTPQLSFTVKYLNCIAGIVITASHNPKEYNGYKVYDEYGCQLVPWQANNVICYVNGVKDFSAINFAGNDSLKEVVDTTDAFVDAVLKQSLIDHNSVKSNLRIVYTPLHGSGNIPVRKALALDGFTHVTVVPEQERPDGYFSTVNSPNPEDDSALNLGLMLSKEIGGEILLATDPDCDRIGVGIRKADGEYKLMTGNQIGALLIDFIIAHKDLSQLHNPAIIKTIVTSDLGAEIGKKHGIAVFSTLTGFKFIGEKITQFEKLGQTYTFLFGYEESFGYLAGTYARDKDAVVSSLLICEMAAFYKAEGKTLLDRMGELYKEYGYYRDALDSFTLKGAEGIRRINSMMADLRDNASPFENTSQIIDYSTPVDAEPGFGKLPASDVLKYILDDNSWVAVRPSGTEPKIKIYYSVKGTNEAEAENRLITIQKTIKNRLGLKRD